MGGPGAREAQRTWRCVRLAPLGRAEGRCFEASERLLHFNAQADLTEVPAAQLVADLSRRQQRPSFSQKWAAFCY